MDPKCSDMRVHKTRQIWTVLVKYTLTPTLSSLWVFGTEASLLSGQRVQTRAPFHFLQTVYRYYGYKALLCWVQRLCLKHYRPVNNSKSIQAKWKQCLADTSLCTAVVWDKRLLMLRVNAYTYRLWVGQRPEPVVVLLSCRIPQAQVYWFPIDHHIGGVVVKAAGREVGG